MRFQAYAMNKFSTTLNDNTRSRSNLPTTTKHSQTKIIGELEQQKVTNEDHSV